MEILGVDFSDAIDTIHADELEEFFVGWKCRPSPSLHLAVLRSSGRAIVARDADTRAVVGFVCAVTDGVMAAGITLLEVLPDYQRCGIGSELVRRMLHELGPLYMVDVVCDEGLLPFYERSGFRRGVAATRRDPAALGPR